MNELVVLLATGEQSDGACKNAAGALLHHAKKSAENAQHVKSAITPCKLDPTREVIQRLLEQVAALP